MYAGGRDERSGAGHSAPRIRTSDSWCGPPRGLRASDIADASDLPLIAAMRPEPMLAPSWSAVDCACGDGHLSGLRRDGCWHWWTVRPRLAAA